MGILQLKRGALVDKPALAEGEPFLDETNGKLIVNIDGVEKTFKPDSGAKVYRALLSQSGTAAPVATVLENTLGGDVVWSRADAGNYYATLNSAFVGNINKMRRNFYNIAEGDNIVLVLQAYNDNSINLTTISASTETGIDSMLEGDYVEILVYP